jgi:hypothetical protein
MMLRIVALIGLMMMGCLGAEAQALQDFDDGFGLWKISPQKVGRSSNPGWKTVSNSGEKAARNYPTGSKVTYYWKLSQVFDLSELESPSLEIKYDYRGHTYSYFRVQVGGADASRLADFTTLHEDTESTGVTTMELDLSEYEGEIVQIRMLLRKPSNTVEKKIGLYVHKLELKAHIPVTIEDCEPYDRDLYYHWSDEDSDCQDTRQESLLEWAVDPVVFLDETACRVASSTWEDPYTALIFEEPIYMDVDHMVPLKEAHQSGGWAWDADTRRDYANHLESTDHLIPVQASANRQKGARDPAEWLPSNPDFIEEYARLWIEVKLAWDLKADAVELATLQDILGDDDTVVYPEEAPVVSCSP